MFRALVVKEWRQLRSLRWAGIGLGAMMPLILLASAEAGTHGWLPAKRLTAYSTATLFFELHPALLIVLWALMGLLISSQLFAGDRAAGTEQFLLERPVARDKVWRARLLVGLTSLLLIVGCHLLAWWPFAAHAATGAPVQAQALKVIAFGGPLTLLVSFTAGLAAASVLGSPIQGLLLGIVLGVLPLAGATVLQGLFPFASYRGASIGLILPVLLLIGYVCASWFVLCKGEPAGRGRFLRGGTVLGAALLSMPLLFVTGTPLAMRLDAGRLESGATILADGRSPLAVAMTGQNGAAWLLDVESKRKLAFLHPPVFQLLTRPDGAYTAVIRSDGSFGRYSSHVRADIYDAEGRHVAGHRIGERVRYLGGDAYWAADHLVTRTYDGIGGGLLIVDPFTGEESRIAIDVSPRNWTLLGPDAAGALYVFRAADDDWPATTRVLLQRIDPERGRLDPPLLEEEGFTLEDEQVYGYFFRHSLSPAGRYLVGPGRGFQDLLTGESYPLGRRARWAWLDGDRLAWLEDRPAATVLLVGAPGDPPRTLGTWQSGSVTLAASPDRARLLVRVYAPTSGGKPFRMEFGENLPADARLRELWVYESATGERVEATDWIDTTKTLEQQQISWAGPRTLGLTGVGRLALRDLGPSSATTYLIGSP